MFAMLAGVFPFMHSHLRELCSLIVFSDVAMPATIPTSVQPVLRSMLHKAPENRPLASHLTRLFPEPRLVDETEAAIAALQTSEDMQALGYTE